ncbi:hypothetical protein P3T73_00845 [Kiritimatiellota bacterium B12222]|nr:hypothetical protein P3T73_00845 [Kiritimatiellota bacterium B12222]
MNYLSLIYISLFLSTPAWTDQITLTLEMRDPQRSYRAGERAYASLMLEGLDLENESENNLHAFEDLNSGFQIDLKKAGDMEIGPVAITLNNKRILSNTLKLTVLPAWDGTDTYLFKVDKNQITHEELFTLTLEIWTKHYLQTSIRTKRDDELFSYQAGGSGNSSETLADGSSQRYISYHWQIKPTKTGRFALSEELFQNLPEWIEVPEFSVDVLPKTEETP